MNTQTGSRLNHVHCINLFYIGFTIIWEALRSTIFHVDGAMRANLILFIIVIFINLGRHGFWKKAGSMAVFGWIAWTVYVIIMKLHFGFNATDVSMNIWIWSKLIFPCSILVISCYECMSSKIRFIKLVTYCLALNLLLILLLGPNQSVRDIEGGLGNGESLKSFVFLVFLCLGYYYKIFGWKLLVIGLIMAFSLTFMIATRKALAAEVIVLLAFFYSKRKFTLKMALATIVLLVVADFAFNFVMDNTFMGERIKAGAETDNSQWNPNNNWFLSLVEDRAYFYVVGWDYFLKYPVFGIGIGNFTYYTGIPELPIHSEYMVQLCECGIIGCIFYLIFMLSMVRGLLKTPFLKGEYLILGAGLLSMLWLSLTAWVYDGCYYMMLYALIISIPRLYLRDKKTGKVKLN